jgi:hypothetical protein
MASEQTLKTIQSLYKDGYLSADFKLFGVPQTTEEAETWIANYQRIRNVAWLINQTESEN